MASSGFEVGGNSKHAARPARVSGVPRILVVDDDDALREIVALTLNRDGFEVLEAACAEEAVSMLEDVSIHEWSPMPIDLLITDLRMRGMGGRQLVESIRTARWPIPAIIMTAFPEPDLVTVAQRLGAAVLYKPFQLAFMRRIVLSTLAAQAKARPLKAAANE